MKIKYNHKKQELSNICKTVDEFIEFLDEKKNIKKWMNFNNPLIYQKMKSFFEYCLNDDTYINFETFNKILIKYFDFKYGFAYSKVSLIEHGFNETEAQEIIDRSRLKQREQIEEDKKKLAENKKNNYSYGKIEFISNVEPVCNLCGEKLVFKTLRNGIRGIVGCSNENCDGYINKSRNNRKMEAILPSDLYDKIILYRKEQNILNPKHWIKLGFSEEEAVKKISEIQKQRSLSTKHNGSRRRGILKKELIEKIGFDGADNFFKERSRLCVEYWQKRGYSKEEAKKNISKLQAENNKYIKEYGKTKRIEYWINKGFSEEEAKKKLSESQRTFSKSICIEKYGEIEGLRRWKERQNKWQKSLHVSEKLHVGYSNISQELFNILSEHLENKEYLFYGSRNHEYCIRDENINYIYDFTDLENRKIIEFQGDIYHANPELFSENDHPNPFYKEKTSKDIWEFDKKKSNIAKKHNFELLHVWEQEYRNNKNDVINKCLIFLKNE